QPLATLEEVLVPMYLFHRYQVEAVSKVIAGVDYSYLLKDDQAVNSQPVSSKDQLKAIESLMTTLKPEFLAVPAKVLSVIPPRPFGYPANQREIFKRNTGLVFDPLGPPEISAQHTLSLMLN